MVSVAPEISTSVRTNKFSNYSIYSVSNKLKSKHQRIDNISLSTFHQNIRGVRSKLDELECHLLYNLPVLLCLMDHHLTQMEIQSLNTENYQLGSYCFRKHMLKGGLCMLIHRNTTFSVINLDRYCIDQDIEICAIQLDVFFSKLCIFTVYRSPLGNFNNFIVQLDSILCTVYNTRMDFIICGNFNIDFLKDTDRGIQLNALLATYNLTNIVRFSTRITEETSTAIDNIFLDIVKYDT
jgi:hypothetical protein